MLTHVMCQGAADTSLTSTPFMLCLFRHHGCESANLLMFMLCLLHALGCNIFTHSPIELSLTVHGIPRCGKAGINNKLAQVLKQ